MSGKYRSSAVVFRCNSRDKVDSCAGRCPGGARTAGVLVIESKNLGISLEIALPQLLAYLLASPNFPQPVYGLLSNGRSFILVKILQGEVPPNALLNGDGGGALKN